MIHKLEIAALLGILVAAGCVAEPAAAPGERLQALGAHSLKIQQHDKHLAITALGEWGNEIAHLDLEVGRFVMDDIMEDHRGEVDGRRMTVVALGASAVHESAGYADLSLPAPKDPGLVAFVTDPTVLDELARWGVGIEPPTRDFTGDFERALRGEQVYNGHCGALTEVTMIAQNATGCTTSTYSGCTATSTRKWFIDGSSEIGEYRCCTANDKRAERRCTSPNSSNSCGPTGSGSCSVCWLETLMGNNYCLAAGSGSTCTLAYCWDID